MFAQKTTSVTAADNDVQGEFLSRDGRRFYRIRNYDLMPPFFISVISSADHWLFISSTGALTAGRVSAEKALFPYITVDKIHDAALHTGSKTLLRVYQGVAFELWEPFNREHDGRYRITRNLYKSLLGDAIVFEEINHDLALSFFYEWRSSDAFGFVRSARVENLAATPRRIVLLDGVQNLMAAGTTRGAQDLTSNLVDAYKWSEMHAPSGVAMYSLYSGMSDRAEPCESLRATTVYALGSCATPRLLCSEQLTNFRRAEPLAEETLRRGVRGAYFVEVDATLGAGESAHWQIVADVEQSQSRVTRQIAALEEPARLAEKVAESLALDAEKLSGIMGSADAWQLTGEEVVTAHHYANVLFNVLRGGVFNDQYRVVREDLSHSIRHFNRGVYERHSGFLASLPDTINVRDLLVVAAQRSDLQLERLCYEYLPITFGRRHGDPSRPWNRFNIVLKDEQGNQRLSYEGNWRDIFQNWEALAFSYPEFIESVIAKFLNASTVDGYNPYRITDRGIDWEVEDPEDPWSYIGYWGDHQIIYLQKLLELSQRFHPGRLTQLLTRPMFAFANVPYRIKPFAQMRLDSKSTVLYDQELADTIEQRVQRLGADGKLLLDEHENVRLVSLAEKLLIPLLSKLSNFAAGGGIWMNTQRPEWNDANNALVGNGLSMVTLYYMRRYVEGLKDLLNSGPEQFPVSCGVCDWLSTAVEALEGVDPATACVDPAQRFRLLERLAQSADNYREAAYSGDAQAHTDELTAAALDSALALIIGHIDCTIARGRRPDGLYHAYNLMHLDGERAQCEPLYLMLEGQVAALSSGAVTPEGAVEVLEALFASDCYRQDVGTFMLYPDRSLPGFLEKNRIPDGELPTALVSVMEARGDKRLFEEDAQGVQRFSGDFRNLGDLQQMLDILLDEYDPPLIERARPELAALYERAFRHRAFTGRSGGMFGFEGLGCVYWHMVAKLLLVVQENFFSALDTGASTDITTRLGQFYYRVREGIGFNKSPQEFGAFPADPYSHTPAHAGARQPGMTGQVKEEVLTRFGELGLRVIDGQVEFSPQLLRTREFLQQSGVYRFQDVHGEQQSLSLPRGTLAYSWCQVPVVYELTEGRPGLLVTDGDGSERRSDGLTLSRDDTAAIAARSGRICRLTVSTHRTQLFGA